MNIKMIIAIVVAAALVAGGAAYILLNNSEPEDRSVSVLAKVNAEGSGIFCKEDISWDEPADWGGKTFMTPGAGSIQHEMLKTFALSNNLHFVSGTGSSSDTIYWAQIAPGLMSTAYATGAYDGGITWEPWYSSIVAEFSPYTVGTIPQGLVRLPTGPGFEITNDGTTPAAGDDFSFSVAVNTGYTQSTLKVYANDVLLTPDDTSTFEYLIENIQETTVITIHLYKSGVLYTYGVITSDEIEPGHPCCMIVANNAFVARNQELTERFLFAYIEAVNWLNDTIDAGRAGTDYEKLERLAWTSAFGGTQTETIPDAKKDMIWDALNNMLYDYSIDGLDAYVAELVQRFENSGAIAPGKVTDRAAFAEKLVNHDFLDKIDNSTLTLEEQMSAYRDPAQSSKGTVRLAVLANDLHQIAVRAAMEKGLIYADKTLFEAYGVNIDLKAFQPNGPAVMNLFSANQIDIGVLGLPPTVIRSANGL